MPRHLAATSIAVVAAASVVACGDDEPAIGPAASQQPLVADTATAEVLVDPYSGRGDDQDEASDEWVTVTDELSGATFQLPDPSQPDSNTAVTEDGTEVALRNYSATTDGGIEVGLNIIDTPGDSYDLEAGVEGVADSLGGEVVATAESEVAGQDAVGVTMAYGGDKLVLYALISTEDHVLQTLAAGPESERPAIEAAYEHLNGSLEVG